MGEIQGDAVRTSGHVPWPDSAQWASGRIAETGAHACVPSQGSRSKGSLQSLALLALLRGRGPGALAVSGAHGAPRREPSAAPRCRRLSQLAAHRRHERRSAGVCAVPAPRHRQPRPALRGGAEGAQPQPAETAVEGGEESVQKRLTSARRTMDSLSTRRGSPAAHPLHTSALTSGQRGTVVDRDPDLLHPALSQLQGHLHSLDSACPPLEKNSDLG